MRSGQLTGVTEGSWSEQCSQEISIPQISPDCSVGMRGGGIRCCPDTVTHVKERSFLDLNFFLVPEEIQSWISNLRINCHKCTRVLIFSPYNAHSEDCSPSVEGGVEHPCSSIQTMQFVVAFAFTLHADFWVPSRLNCSQESCQTCMQFIL